MTMYIIDEYIFTSLIMAHDYLTAKELENK